ncbi:MAG: ABC transporter ATP-binding protein [Prosthecobacter sp.]
MIQLQNISKAFGSRPVLQDLSLQVDRGRILGLLGGNGAGKTTTLNLILGFLQPDSGTITVTGETAYIPENVALYPELSGLENLRAFAALAGRDLSTQEGESLLARVKLPAEAMSRRLASYSKGMRQRVAIAIALARQAQVFLLDEPTTGLDPAAVQDLATLLRQLAQDGAAILLTTHDLWHLSIDSDEVAILSAGRLVDRFEVAGQDAAQLAQRYLQAK